MTIDTLAQQIKTLTDQVAKLDAIVNKTTTQTTTTTTESTPKKQKKEKKVKSTPSDDEKPKKVSGYILFSKANRQDAIETLQGSGEEELKIKSTDVMKELGKMWKLLENDEREQWNTKAKDTMETA